VTSSFALTRNRRGQSLVQVLVSVAIAGILLMVMVSMQSLQGNENRALAEKLAANDLARVITSILSNSASCSLLFTSPGNIASGSLTFDASAVSTTRPSFINLNSIATVGGPPIAVAGKNPSTFSNSLIILAATGIQVAVTSATTANLLVNFDQTKLVRAIHSLSFPLVLQTGPPATTITGCQSGGTPRTWVDVMASRAVMTSYTNATDHDIEVSVSTYSGLAFLRCSIYLLVNGVVVGSNFTNDTSTALCNATATVPPGATYEAVNTLATPPNRPGENILNNWTELR
jgi:hypothetical protein